jgi:hypothetical protein
MEKMDKAQLEAELILAQKEKVNAEIAILKKTTPLTEGIKTVSSLVVGLGGAILAIGGFQFADIKAERSKLEAEKALQIRDSTKREITKIEQTLIHKRDSLQKRNDSLQIRITRSLISLEQITDKITLAQSQPQSQEALGTLQQDANAAAIDLRASVPSSQVATTSVKSLNTSIEELFAPKASVRGAAYNQLMKYYANSPDLVPSLLKYANNHLDNANGIYNTLVVFSHLNYNKVPQEALLSIRSFAEQTRNNGSKTADRVTKLLKRLPR